MKLEVKNLKKSFDDVLVLDDISFTLNEGDIAGFVGTNGAGKTTTIKAIFNEYRIDEGEILIDGESISKDNLKEMEFFPDQNNFPKDFKIIDYCWYNYQLTFPKAKHAEFKNLFKDVVKALSLGQQMKSKFSQLSSGMQKRALLAAVLVTKPKILFLDEPTSNVDIKAKREFIELLKELAGNLGLIILITTHQIEELEKFANCLIF
ncbi:antibiotic transport system ATP-binding protein [Spiroplasma clarkii]|nr:ABC transporter ATP-binding protein [Spiroplasma clarkii]ARU92231.1 antibiotic transport system ATP-binding protein [Spiroplasma clarkii]